MPQHSLPDAYAQPAASGCRAALGKTLRRFYSLAVSFFLLAFLFASLCTPVFAQEPPVHRGGGEANLVLPDLSSVTFLGGIDGRTLLLIGLGIAALGLVFGLIMYTRLRDLPVHASMLEISELIYETCKTYLLTQGKFLMILEVILFMKL